MGDWVLFLGVFLYRLINAVLIRTYLDPDEYWQCTEIAHKVVFGYGYETWDWEVRLRNWACVLPFIAIFKLIKLLHLDTDFLIVLSNSIFSSSSYLDICSETSSSTDRCNI